MANILPVSDLRNYNEVLKNCHKEGFLCYQEKCQTEICCPAKSEIYKKKRGLDTLPPMTG